MRRFLAVAFAAALVLSVSAPVMAAKPPLLAASITVNELGPFAIGDSVTFTVTVPKGVHPLVYLACYADADQHQVYGQFGRPHKVFILGGDWSQWTTPTDPHYLAPAVCAGYLYADNLLLLAQTKTFPVP